jgi:hypothetical protein
MKGNRGTRRPGTASTCTGEAAGAGPMRAVALVVCETLIADARGDGGTEEAQNERIG